MTRLLLLALLLPACTLDFEEFRPFTPGQPRPDAEAPKDAGAEDAEADAQPDAEPDAEPDVEWPDRDDDGVPDGADNCPDDPNPDQADADGDGFGDACDVTDADGDGRIDDEDNCPNTPNPAQLDMDRDGLGDACDPDIDGDGLDEAQEAANGTDPLRPDTDGDGLTDGADACPLFADRVGLDTDNDGRGDACDMDDDGDGLFDWDDPCPGSATVNQPGCGGDLDGDGVPDANDTCPALANPDQAITPCQSRFEVLGYDQDLRDAAALDARVLLAGASGLLDRAPDGQISRFNSGVGLSGHRLNKIFVDEGGRVWLTHERGLSIIRPDGLIINLFADDLGGRPQGQLHDVVVDGLAQIWVSSELGLNVLAGGAWALKTTADGLPSNDTRGLHLDGAGRVWIATAGGLAKIEAGQIQAAPLAAALGGLRDIVDDGAGGLWVFGEGGLTRLNGVGAEIPGAAITGMSVLGIATRGEVHYLITDEGVRRLDAAGRLYPTSAALLNGAARAIVGPTDEADPFWLATAGGAVALDGYFASFPAADLPQGCVRDSARFNGALWLATSAGLFRGVGDAFEATPPADLPSPDARVIRQVGEEIWVGTNAGVARFDVTGLALGQITAADGIPNMPVSDALRTTRYTWLSTLGGGLARQPLDPPDAPWEIFNSASGLPNYTSDQIRALAFDGQRLWAGTLAGLMIFDEETDSFLFPISEVGARLPNNSVNDVLIFDGQVFAATDGGVALQTPEGAWTAIQRVSQDVPNIPLEAGTDFARALSEDGEYVWILLNPGRGQDFGGLVRWSPSAPATLFTAADAGLLETQALDGAALRSLDGELFISYCGVDGGLTLLDGAGVVAARVKEGLPGDGAYAAMTESAGGGLLFASEIEDQRWVFELRDGALSPLSLPASITALPVDCAMPLEGAQLWCILDGYGVARYIPNPDPQRPGTWSPFELSGTTPTCVAAQSPTVAWVGTTTGITLIDGPQINRINSAMTGGGLPGDEIRQLKLSPQRRLYAATQAGVGIYDLDANSWTALTEGIDLDVYAVAPSPTDPSFWVGTARGLFHVVAGQPPRPLTEAQGAPTVAVYDLEIDAAGQVFAATELGLLRGSPDGAFELLGFNDGLPGRRALELVLTADGDVWVRSDDGLARLR